MNKMAQIQIQNIEKSFGDFRALKGIDLQIADQEFLVLLGASGCGKSTLLRIMAGLETADAGQIHVGESRIDNLAPRDRGLSMVFQNYAVFPHLTVFENIAFGLRMQKKPQAWVEKRSRKSLNWCTWKCCCIATQASFLADSVNVWP
jgi:multiple sugar transport system ATP-binding protein